MSGTIGKFSTHDLVHGEVVKEGDETYLNVNISNYTGKMKVTMDTLFDMIKVFNEHIKGFNIPVETLHDLYLHNEIAIVKASYSGDHLVPNVIMITHQESNKVRGFLNI